MADKLVERQSKISLKIALPQDANLTNIAYGLYAYDSVLVHARALDEYLNDGGNISFSSDPNLQASDGRSGHLNRKAMSIFNGGEILLEKIKDISIEGVTSLIQFD